VKKLISSCKTLDELIVSENIIPLHKTASHSLDNKHKFRMDGGMGNATNSEESLHLAGNMIKAPPIVS
jgi:hypothetical protein